MDRALNAIDQVDQKATETHEPRPQPILTPRELAVLELLSRGRTNREIAAELYMSTSTAGVHVSNILHKLGARRRVEAAGLARLTRAAISRLIRPTGRMVGLGAQGPYGPLSIGAGLIRTDRAGLPSKVSCGLAATAPEAVIRRLPSSPATVGCLSWPGGRHRGLVPDRAATV